MANELLQMVSYLEKERGVSRDIIVQAIESAIKQSAKHSPDVTSALEISIDPKTLKISAFDYVTVSSTERGTGFISPALARKIDPNAAEGDHLRVAVPPTKLGRIAAVNARQLIVQKIREAERKNVFDEFKDRVGDIVSGVVRSIDRRDIYVDLGRCEAVLPAKERIPTEEYAVGDPIRAYVQRVKQDDRGPSIQLSRACNDFLKRLFALEVAEIADGVVEILSVARDPGFRSKIAVRTYDDRIDPVGACVGLKGARVHNIVRELNGEKIDVIRWNEDICTFVRNAIQPARPLDIVEDPNGDTIFVDVDATQQSLAIGRRGQNVRLASRLVGCNVSVRKVEDLGSTSFEEQREATIKRHMELFDLDEDTASKLLDAGFASPDGVAEVESAEAFAAQVEDLDADTAIKIYAAARAVLEARGTTDEEA